MTTDHKLCAALVMQMRSLKHSRTVLLNLVAATLLSRVSQDTTTLNNHRGATRACQKFKHPLQLIHSLPHSDRLTPNRLVSCCSLLNWVMPRFWYGICVIWILNIERHTYLQYSLNLSSLSLLLACLLCLSTVRASRVCQTKDRSAFSLSLFLSSYR